MMENYKIIQFDLSKAKTPDNPNGLDVVTKEGEDVRIICTNKLGTYPIVGLVCHKTFNVDNNMVKHDINVEYMGDYSLEGERSYGYSTDVLVLKEPIKSRRMTNQELSWWLRECPEEHREVTVEYKDTIHSFIGYTHNRADEEVSERVKIRVNGGKWREPLIEEEIDNGKSGQI